MRPVPVWSVVLTAVGAALLVWLLAVPLAGVELVIPARPSSGVASGGPSPIGQSIGAAAVAIVAALATLAAWPVSALLRRSAARSVHPAGEDAPGSPPDRRLGGARRPVGWWVTCGAVLVVSLAGPLGAGSAAAVAALVGMHVAVACVVVVGLDPRRTRRSSRTPRADAPAVAG